MYIFSMYFTLFEMLLSNVYSYLFRILISPFNFICHVHMERNLNVFHFLLQKKVWNARELICCKSFLHLFIVRMHKCIDDPNNAEMY